MARSKRARLVHTSRVQKKPSKLRSTNLYTTLRTVASTSPHILLFSVSNMRNTHLKTVRQELSSGSRIFFGKTKVMAKALGLTQEEEAMPGLSKLSKFLRGDVGVICTEKPIQEILNFVEEFSEVDFARAGTVAPRGFTVPAGVVYSTGGEQPVEDDVPLPHSLEATVRKWGMPTRMEKGRVVLDQEFVVCEEGKVLDSNQTSLLKCFGVAVAEFRVTVVAYWSESSGEVTVVDAVDAVHGEGGEVEDESMDED